MADSLSVCKHELSVHRLRILKFKINTRLGEVSYKRRLGLKSGQSNQKRNIRVHRRDRKERREKKINNLCVLSDLCGEILLGTASDFMWFHTSFTAGGAGFIVIRNEVSGVGCQGKKMLDTDT